jgi:3-deoxy-7-phosphoheptulonate synthase
MAIAGAAATADFRKICPLVSRRTHAEEYAEAETRTVQVKNVKFGGARRSVVIAGPCSVESYEQTMELAQVVKQCGGDMLRGGAFKPRTSPHDFQGLGIEGLQILKEASRQTGLPIVTEVMDPRLVEKVGEYADMLQIGSRNMQNYPLLVEVGRYGKPVLLKRGMAASLCEWLGAAEYIAQEGNLNIVLCERGIKAYPAGEYCRFILDLNVLHALKQETFLPVIVDPSHATGVAAMVEPASRAAIESGAHGLLIEIASDRADAARPKCDAAQAIGSATLSRIVEFVRNREVDSEEVKAHAV